MNETKQCENPDCQMSVGTDYNLDQLEPINDGNKIIKVCPFCYQVRLIEMEDDNGLDLGEYDFTDAVAEDGSSMFPNLNILKNEDEY